MPPRTSLQETPFAYGLDGKLLLGNRLVTPKTNLLILDDFGLHGRRSTLATCQIPVDEWHELIGDGCGVWIFSSRILALIYVFVGYE